MKSVFITFNQALREDILFIMELNTIKGYTLWEIVQGEGSKEGEPHLGNHAWPTLNSAMTIVTEDEKVKPFLSMLKKLDEKSPMQGLRAFVSNIEEMI